MKRISVVEFALIAVALMFAGCDKPTGKAEAGDKTAAAATNATSQPAGEKKPVENRPAEKAAVRFVFPQDGSKVFENFPVAFGVSGMQVVPAGQAPGDKTKGHHHLIIDGDPIAKGTVVPKDATHLHFGKGQTAADVKLAPGKHKLTMQFADAAHMSYGPELSTTINVEVVARPKETKVMFLAPKDGAKIKGPVKMKFGVGEGMKVRPAGEDPLDKTSGHHHVIVDGKPLPVGVVVPKDATHIHYGKGQTEAELKLAPGKHTLTLQFADGAHASYGPALSQTITVEVE